jgi:DNA-binding transcriptional LysR family regulator
MKHLDLNLLRLLVALEQTRHLGRAAESLEMSQSGFSTALSRLRVQVGDALFVRSGAGMRPTPRALALAETARAVLLQVEQDVLGSGIFDPAKAVVTFRLSMSDVAEVVFLPALLAHLSQHVPRASVQVVSPSLSPLHERLAAGEVDIAIGYMPGLEKDAFFRQALYSHSYACIARRDHPSLGKGMSRAAYQAVGHAVVAAPTRSNALLDAAIERLRIRRRVVLSLPGHLSLPPIIAATDLVASVPLGTAVDFGRSGELVVLPLPFRPPIFTIYLYWHRRTHKEPGCQWLRSEMQKLFNTENDPYREQRTALYGRG